MTGVYIAAKIHGIHVTEAAVEYTGSVTVDGDLLTAVGIDPYEQVHVVNLATGGRWVTYTLPGKPGQFSLNGGGARLGVVGDPCVLMTYRTFDRFPGARVVFCDQYNAINRHLIYPPER